MLIQLTTPRVAIDQSRYDRYIYIRTLVVPDVSTGEVLFTYPTDPEYGEQDTVILEPKEVLLLNNDVCVRTHVLPFWELFRNRSEKIRLSRLCTSGFQVSAESAFRSNTRKYDQRTFAFTVVFPITGDGCLLRFADLDIANPTFDPWEVPAGSESEPWPACTMTRPFSDPKNTKGE